MIISLTTNTIPPNAVTTNKPEIKAIINKRR